MGRVTIESAPIPPSRYADARSPLRDELDLILASRRPARLAEETLRAALDAPVPRPRRGRPLSRPASIVIVTHNNLPFTKLCVHSVLANTGYPGYELIVIDNGSQDDTPEFLGELGRVCPNVRIVRNSDNFGFAAANNQGLQLAGGEVLVLINNDTLVPPGWLEGLAAHLDDDRVGAVGPVTNRTCNEAQIDAPYRTYGDFVRFAADRASAHAGRATDIPMLAMFCLAMRREVFEEVGPLDQRFGLGLFEDDDYSMRLRRAGYRTVCAEDVFVHHFGEASFGGLACDGGYAGLLEANRKRFEQKWGVAWRPHGRRPDPKRDAEVDAVRRAVAETVPAGATVAVISKGNDDLLRLDGRTGWHFPRGEDGVYAGHYPADGAAAAEHLEGLRAKGADYLVVPPSASWWLEHYGQFALHLDRHHRRLLPDPEGCVVYALSASRQTSPEALYLDLVKRCLTNWVHGDAEQPPFDPDKRADGQDWPPTAHTMVGLRRLDNVQRCVEDVLARGVPGDLIETGAWRGGVCILMRAILKAHGVSDRTVWVADSFRGLPAPDADRYPSDAGDHHHAEPFLAVPLERVKDNFRRYDLLDGQVRFLEGWFRDTLPDAPVDRLAVLRLDGDMYESTMDGLVHLYPKLSPGGYVIVDDYGYCANCRRAVDDYRAAHGITAEIRRIDWTGVYWMK